MRHLDCICSLKRFEVKVRRERIKRVTKEAFKQGTLLTAEDMAYKIFSVGYRTTWLVYQNPLSLDIRNFSREKRSGAGSKRDRSQS
jgi:hypothetical protein